MMSPDVNALLASFGGSASAVTKPPSPGPVPTGETDYAKLLQGIGAVGFGIGGAGREIGAAKAAQVEADIARDLAKVEAGAVEREGRRRAMTARAIAGAQGTTMEGSPLLAELAILQGASEDAYKKRYQGEIDAYYAEQKKKAAYGRVLPAFAGPIIGGAGTSLLTGKY